MSVTHLLSSANEEQTGDGGGLTWSPIVTQAFESRSRGGLKGERMSVKVGASETDFKRGLFHKQMCVCGIEKSTQFSHRIFDDFNSERFCQ